MNLEAQIELLTNPQDFTRLCNATLQVEHGDDFLPIDDDRPDRGNDGYLKSQKRMFAAHCFKRIQNRGIDSEIRSKMLSDLRKAIKLKQDGEWDVCAWTFLSNYPVPEGIAVQVAAVGASAGIDVSWRGPAYFAEALQRFATVRELFPNLLASEVMSQLDSITKKLDSLSRAEEEPVINWVPRDPQEQLALVSQKPPAWEYLLFAGVLSQGKERLEPKWRDFRSGHARRTGRYLDSKSSMIYLGGIWTDSIAIVEGMDKALEEGAQIEAFGAPGHPGDPASIEYLAMRIVTSYEDLLDWAADIRGSIYPDEMKTAFELAARVAIQPVNEIRAFIDQAAADIGRISQLLSEPDPQPISLILTLKLT